MTPQEKQNARVANQAAAAGRVTARQGQMATRKTAQEERVNKREELKDTRAEKTFQRCIKLALPAAIKWLRDDCIANPGGQSCNQMAQGNYPVCVSVNQLRGKPPTQAELDCGAAYLSCKENLLPQLISEQAGRCAANPAGQDCKDIAAKKFPRCASCGEQ